MNIKNAINKGIKRLYEDATPQGIAFFIQVLVVIGWLVCTIMDSIHPGTHWRHATMVHLDINFIVCIVVVILGFTKFGRTPIFPKFITYDPVD